MKLAHTLLALLFAGVINLQAQTPPTPTPAPAPAKFTKNEKEWIALIDLKKSKTAVVKSSESIIVKDKILEGESLTRWEASIVGEVVKAKDGNEAYRTAYRTLAKSNKSGPGVSFAKACVKLWDNDSTGWSEDMIIAMPDVAVKFAKRPDATAQFKADVWAVVKTQGAHKRSSFFKSYRSTLLKAEQIAVTQKQKDLMLAITNREALANAWLAEMSADLVALQLDQ